MSIITRAMRDDLVYWPRTGNSSSGKPIYGAPQELKCRWQHSTRQIIMPDGGRVLCTAELITEFLLSEKGFVCLGTLNTISYWADPPANTGAYELLSVAKTPDLRYKKILYEAFV